MILSKREHKIAMVTLIVIVILFLDRFLFTPYIKKRDMLMSEIENLVVQMRKSRGILLQWKELSSGWENTVKADRQTAETGIGSGTLNALRQWAEESNMSLSLLKPEGANKKEKLDEHIFQVVATGSMMNISRFLWKVESSQLPLKIKNLQLATRKEGSDDLTLQVRIGELHPPSSLLFSQKTSSETSIKAEEIK